MFILADIEATCWEQHKKVDDNEIIEIGFLVCNVKGEVLDSYQTFVKPVTNIKLSGFCKKLTGIEQRWVNDAPSLFDAVSDIARWFDLRYSINSSQMAWTSWGDWDPVCFEKDCDRHKIAMPFGNHVDLKQHYFNLRGVEVGLREATEREGFPWRGRRHRAIADAENSLNIARLVL